MGRTKKDKPAPRQDGATFSKAYTTKLPVHIEPEVVAELADEMAKGIRTRGELQEERRSVMAGFKKRFDALDEREKELATAVESHTTLQEIEVHEYIRRDQAIEVIRTDTGEVVEVRTAKAEDLQENLPLDGAPANGTAGDPTDTSQLAQEVT